MCAKPKSNAVQEETLPLFTSAMTEAVSADIAMETADAARPLLTTVQGRRIEQIYELADILASIFETLPDEYETAIATMPKAA